MTGRHQDWRVAPSLVRTGLLRGPVQTEDRRCGVRLSNRRTTLFQTIRGLGPKDGLLGFTHRQT